MRRNFARTIVGRRRTANTLRPELRHPEVHAINFAQNIVRKITGRLIDLINNDDRALRHIVMLQGMWARRKQTFHLVASIVPRARYSMK